MSEDDSPQLVRDIAPFGVRMPADLKERIQAAAKANGRSTNAEVVAALENAYPADDGYERLVRMLEQANELRLRAKTERERSVYNRAIERISDEISEVLKGSGTL